jgi:hypothetical protein
VDFADACIPAAVAPYGAEDADAFKIGFQHRRVVIEMGAVSAATPIRRFLCTKCHPAKPIHEPFYPITFRESTKAENQQKKTKRARVRQASAQAMGPCGRTSIDKASGTLHSSSFMTLK